MFSLIKAYNKCFYSKLQCEMSKVHIILLKTVEKSLSSASSSNHALRTEAYVSHL